MNTVTEKEIRTCIMRNPRSILQIPENERTKDLLVLAVSKDPTLLGPLETSILPVEVRITAIRTDPTVITLLSNPSVSEQLTAVRVNGILLGSLIHPSESVQIEAVRQNPSAVQYMQNPTEEILRKAIAANGKVLYYLQDPSETIIDYALDLSGLNIRYLSPWVETKAIMLKALESRQRGEVIRYFNEVYGGLFWFGRHFKHALNDAMQLGINFQEITNLLSATLKNEELEFSDTQLINPWGKVKGKCVTCKKLHIGINTHTSTL